MTGLLGVLDNIAIRRVLKILRVFYGLRLSFSAYTPATCSAFKNALCAVLGMRILRVGYTPDQRHRRRSWWGGGVFYSSFCTVYYRLTATYNGYRLVAQSQNGVNPANLPPSILYSHLCSFKWLSWCHINLTNHKP